MTAMVGRSLAERLLDERKLILCVGSRSSSSTFPTRRRGQAWSRRACWTGLRRTWWSCLRCCDRVPPSNGLIPLSGGSGVNPEASLSSHETTLSFLKDD